MRTIESLGDLTSRTVLVRADLNVPLNDGTVSDEGRIVASLPTIRTLSAQGARVIVVSHLGRPGGEVKPELSLRPVASRLGELLETDVTFVDETVGAKASAVREAMADGDVVVLENLRFNAAETSKDAAERQAFAEQLAQGADAFVSDGFGVVHRQQASVTELAALLPSAAGLLIAAESEVLERLTERPERPSVVVLGGSKVSDKLGVIAHLLERVDTILIGGGMMFTFLKAQGHDVAASLLEVDQLDTVRGYMKKAEELGVKLVLPVDAIVAERFAADAAHETVGVADIANTAFGESGMGLDIGPESAKLFAAEIAQAKTVFWNGPMGVFEMQAFAQGTREVAQALVDSEAFTVVGGGDSAAAVRALGFADSSFGHISTGGGASLEYLEGKSLPGLEVLK
ncbi:phosphoglycerate kinase [Leucobacter chinensis]|uniref:phosphoglycerate kinase n=1 Tax=Leucobacter chinensis TaxID=2851010 RepID=UPI001C243283|nr:phosphoglycerate kinase [Leucobacter chinensis]